MEDVGEGAVRLLLVQIQVRVRLGHAFKLGHVVVPLWVIFEILGHSLMTEVDLVIAPEGGSELGGAVDASDLHLGATQLFRSRHAVDSPKLGSNGDLGEEIDEVCVTFLDS